MPQGLTDDLGFRPPHQGQRGEGVPKIMKPQVLDPGTFHNISELMSQHRWIMRTRGRYRFAMLLSCKKEIVLPLVHPSCFFLIFDISSCAQLNMVNKRVTAYQEGSGCSKY